MCYFSEECLFRYHNQDHQVRLRDLGIGFRSIGTGIEGEWIEEERGINLKVRLMLRPLLFELIWHVKAHL